LHHQEFDEYYDRTSKEVFMYQKAKAAEKKRQRAAGRLRSAGGGALFM